MSKKLIFALAIIVLALVAVFVITRPEKQQNYLANLDKTNFSANNGSSGGLASMFTSLLAIL